MALSKILPASISQPKPSNLIINGAMNVAQRGTSATGLGGSNGYFVCDRWNIAKDASDGRFTMSQDSSAPSGFANSLKLDCTTADASIAAGEQLLLQQRIEGQDLQRFAKGTSDAKPFAVSFYVKGNTTATYCCELRDRDNDRTAGKLFNVTTDWTRVELIFDADTTGAFDDDNARSLDLNIFLHAGATFNADGGTLQQTFGTRVNGNRAVGISSFYSSVDRTFFITGVQLEVGQNPTEFEHEPFERTLLKCQRYYAKSYGYETVPGSNTSGGAVFSRYYNAVSNRTDLATRFPVTMRTTPDVTPYSLNGTVDKISDCSTGVTHLSNKDVTTIQNIGQTGFGGMSVTSLNDTAAYHYEVEAEL